MLFVKERLSKWIQAAIILVVGILCIIAGAKLGSNSLEAIASVKDVLDGISMTLGILMIVVGSLSLIMALYIALNAGKGFAAVAAPGAILLAIGISLVVVKYAYTFIDLMLVVTPYLLIAMGGVVLLEAIFILVNALKAKQGGTALLGFVFALAIAAGAIVLGALCVGENPVIQYGAQLVVFGVVVTLVGALQFLATFIKLPDTVVVVEKK